MATANALIWPQTAWSILPMTALLDSRRNGRSGRGTRPTLSGITLASCCATRCRRLNYAQGPGDAVVLLKVTTSPAGGSVVVN